jgi:hypothetical protein
VKKLDAGSDYLTTLLPLRLSMMKYQRDGITTFGATRDPSPHPGVLLRARG